MRTLSRLSWRFPVEKVRATQSRNSDTPSVAPNWRALLPNCFITRATHSTTSCDGNSSAAGSPAASAPANEIMSGSLVSFNNWRIVLRFMLAVRAAKRLSHCILALCRGEVPESQYFFVRVAMLARYSARMELRHLRYLVGVAEE